MTGRASAAPPLGREGDVAAERLGGDAGGALPEGEVQALVLVIARPQRDREIAFDPAIEGGDAELCADVGGKRQPDLAGVRVVLVAAVGEDLSGELHVAARRVGADLLRHDVLQIDVAAHRLDLHVAARRAQRDVAAHGVDHRLAVHPLDRHVTRERLDVDAPRVPDVDVRALRPRLEVTMHALHAHAAAPAPCADARAGGHRDLEPPIVAPSSRRRLESGARAVARETDRAAFGPRPYLDLVAVAAADDHGTLR